MSREVRPKKNIPNSAAGPVSEEVLQNLMDAGCDAETIDGYLDCGACGRDQIKLLRNHRRCLLDKLHQGQKQIDCLDYLIYQIEKERRK